MTMKTIYQQQVSIAETEEGLFLVNGHRLNERPMSLEWIPLTPELRLQGRVKLEVTSKWVLELCCDEGQEWQGSVREIASQVKMPTILPSRSLHFDCDKGQFFIEGKALPINYLTDLEHRLLSYMYQQAGRVCTYKDLINDVWVGWADNNTICQTVYRLRRKLKKRSPNPKKQYIETCRGYRRGYMLVS